MVLAPLGANGIDEAGTVSRSWQPCHGVVFDTSFFHSAYNDSDEIADILFIDFFHPELTNAETNAIRHFQRMLREEGKAAQA